MLSLQKFYGFYHKIWLSFFRNKDILLRIIALWQIPVNREYGIGDRGSTRERHMKYNIPIKKGEPVFILKGELEDYSSPVPHSHACHQFLMIRDGVSLLIDNKFKRPLYGTMCAFIPAGLPHRTTVTGTSLTYQSVYLRKEYIINREEIIIFHISELGRTLFNRMADNADSGFGKGTPDRVFTLFLEIAAEDMLNTNISLDLPEPVSPECGKIINYIESNYMNNITSDKFRSVLPFSSRHISRLFKDEMKMTILSYLRIYRMIMASVKLHDTSKSVLEISLECGYESISSFYTDFNRFFSITPGDFRKSL